MRPPRRVFGDPQNTSERPEAEGPFRRLGGGGWGRGGPRHTVLSLPAKGAHSPCGEERAASTPRNRGPAAHRSWGTRQPPRLLLALCLCFNHHSLAGDGVPGALHPSLRCGTSAGPSRQPSQPAPHTRLPPRAQPTHRVSAGDLAPRPPTRNEPAQASPLGRGSTRGRQEGSPAQEGVMLLPRFPAPPNPQDCSGSLVWPAAARRPGALAECPPWT